MKQKILLSLLMFSYGLNSWSEVGDVFIAKTIEGVDMTFKVTSETILTEEYLASLGEEYKKYVGTKYYTVQVATDVAGERAIPTDYVGPITIPDSINGYIVTEIANNAFRGITGLTSVYIPDQVKIIWLYAFQGCTELTSVRFPDPNNSYFDVAPNSLTIGAYAFAGCKKLKSIELADRELKKIAIGEDSTYIGNLTISHFAFRGCESLVSVKLPEGTTSILGSVFSDCSNLETLYLPSTLEKIGGNGAMMRDGGVEKFRTVYSYMTDPVEIEQFEFDHIGTITIYVPLGTKSKYEATKYWYLCPNIVELAELSKIQEPVYIDTESQNTEYYYLNGVVTSKQQRGINIIKSNGKSRKYITK